jgi:hypothetical protein
VCLLRGTFYVLPTIVCVLCVYKNKQRLFHFTTLIDWLVFISETDLFTARYVLHYNRRSVFTARYVLHCNTYGVCSLRATFCTITQIGCVYCAVVAIL